MTDSVPIDLKNLPGIGFRIALQPAVVDVLRRTGQIVGHEPHEVMAEVVELGIEELEEALDGGPLVDPYNSVIYRFFRPI